MNPEPRHWSDYSARQIEAARRVLVDVGQVLAAFEDAIVIVGGWVPDLLLPHAEPEHIGSVDVDLALVAIEKPVLEIAVSFCGGGAWESNPPNPPSGESHWI